MTMRRRSVQDSPVFRLRTRRALSAFLKLHHGAGKPVEVFEPARVERMLQSGQPDAAEHYLEGFLPPVSFRDRSPLSSLLLVHVRVYRILSKVAAGGQAGATVASLFANPGEYLLQSPYSARLHRIIARMHADHTRASLLWQKVEPDARDKIMDLVARCPELQGEVRLPRKRPLLWDAAPHGLRQCPSRCRKTTNRAPADVLIRKFVRKRLLSTQGRNHSARYRNVSSQSVTPHMKMEQIAPQPAILGGVSYAPVLHHIPPTMASPSITSGIFSSATNAAIGELGDSSNVLKKQDILELSRSVATI